MRILTNFANAPERMLLSFGRAVSVVSARTLPEFIERSRSADAVLINGDTELIFGLAAYFAAAPLRRKPLVAADVVLRAPGPGIGDQIRARVKRTLFSRVDHFIHYFTDLSGYAAHYGIAPARSSYVPFKANVWEVVEHDRTSPDGDYVLAMGISHRDYQTFVDVVSELPYPAVIPRYSFEKMEDRATTFGWTRDALPPNLTVADDSGGRDDVVRHLRGAKIVVVPIRETSICASGISTYLDAMCCGKCVIVSRGPGASDVLTDEAVLVPAGNRAALKDAIVRAWEDDAHRESVAARGHAYALRCGGERDLLERVIAQTVRFVEEGAPARPRRQLLASRRAPRASGAIGP